MFGFHNTKEITGYYSGTETDRMPYIAISDNSTTTPVTIVEHENGEKWVTSTVQNEWCNYNDNYISKAYFDAANGRLAVNGRGNTYMAAVNLNLGKIKSISRLRFTTTIGGKGGGALLF